MYIMHHVHIAPLAVPLEPQGVKFFMFPTQPARRLGAAVLGLALAAVVAFAEIPLKPVNLAEPSETDAKIAIQFGHAGPKGSTQLGWETMDAPLPSGNWKVMAPSAVAWSADNQTI